MFGTLKNILNKDWQENEDNRFITFITENEESTYEVFSVYEEKASDYPIQTGFSNDNEYLNFLNTIKDKSIKDFNVELSVEKGILTLSTCGNDNKNRVILHAIKEN